MRVDYFVPIALKTEIEVRLGKVLHLFPAWVNVLTVRWAPNEDDIATADPQYEYRAMTLTLHPPFLEDPDWESSLIHEIGHGIMRPYVQVVDKIVEKFVSEGMQGYLTDLLALKEEEVVEDWAIFIKKLK